MQVFPILNPNDAGLSVFLREIRKFPLLDPQVERDMALRRRDLGDTDATRQLAESHLRLVVGIAKKYRGYGLPLGDLIAEGNVGLMEGIERFDPDKGARLATYAPWWIRAAIHNYVMRSVSIVRIGTSTPQKKLFFNLRRLVAQEREHYKDVLSPVTVRKIAKQLDVKESEVVEMHQRLRAKTVSLNASNDDDGELAFQELLVDKSPMPEEVVAEAEEAGQRHEALLDALGTLNARERDILTERRLREPRLTLDQLGERYGVTRERIRQIEFRAFEKIQIAITGDGGTPPAKQSASRTGH